MTNIVAAFLSPVAFASKAENNKGSLTNRLEYETKQIGNSIKTLTKDRFITAAGMAATGVATGVVANSKTAQNAIVKAGKKILSNESVKNTLSEVSNFVKPYATKALAFVKANPKTAAAVAVVGTVGCLLTDMIARHNRDKGIYEAGKIDQQYTDKARAEKLLG